VSGDRAVSANEITEGLVSLGIRNGDTVYMRARVAAIGRIASPGAKTIVRGIIDAIGGDGLVLAPTFTNLGLRWKSPRPKFDRNTPSYTGALGRALLSHPDSIRSEHPSHSFVALGRGAREFLAAHDETQPSHMPIRRLVEVNAKMVIVGCNSESPGFSTVHLVQEELGLTQQHYTKLFLCCEVVDKQGQTKVWRPSEYPGCSRGFDKAYRHYIADDNFIVGRVGKAQAIRVDAARAYAKEKELLTRNPRALLCDHADCLSCRTLNGYNLREFPRVLIPFLSKLRRKLADS
jgi:aminoglycoside 3-N-acetyltransferase